MNNRWEWHVGTRDVDGVVSDVTEPDGADRRDDGDVDTGRAAPQRPRPGIIDRLRLMLRATVADQMVLHGRARVVMVGICVVVVLSVGWWAVRPERPPPEASMPFITDTSPAPPADVNADIVVHVAGAVQRAGVVILTEGARVVDAVQAVGGLTADADLSRMNLALTLTDGAAVIVPIVGEPLPIDTSSGVSGPVRLNTADAVLLETLPGVGPATALAIITERDTAGPFIDVDDRDRVPGIGPATLERLRPLVVP